MRAQFLAFTFLATVVASSALAQQAASPPAKTFMNNKEIMGLVDKARSCRSRPIGPSSNTVPPYRRRLSTKKTRS